LGTEKIQVRCRLRQRPSSNPVLSKYSNCLKSLAESDWAGHDNLGLAAHITKLLLWPRLSRSPSYSCNGKIVNGILSHSIKRKSEANSEHPLRTIRCLSKPPIVQHARNH